MDKVDVCHPLNTLESHPKRFYGVSHLKCRTDAPADDFLGIGIQDERQVAEDVCVFIKPYRDICDITNP